ncbi:MAG: MFS transporter [Desulfovibrio sp.]
MTKLYLQRNLLLCFGVTLIAIMSVSSIVPALALMSGHLGFTKSSIGLVITSFTFPGILVAPLVGIFADRIGRKKILVPSLFVFGIFGTACFFAPNMQWLLALRFIQGIAAGAIGLVNLTIIGDLYSGNNGVKAMGYNSSVLSLGTASFPAVGGLLALGGWNWPFLLPIIAIPLGLAVAALMDNPEPDGKEKLNAYFKEAFKGIKRPQVISLFFISLLTFTALFGPFLVYIPLMLNTQFHADSATIGFCIAASSLLTAITAANLGTLERKFGEKNLMRVAFLCYGCSMAIMPHVTEFELALIPICIFGIGQGLNMPSLMARLSSLAPHKHRAAYMSLNGMMLRLGQTLGPVLGGLTYVKFGMSGVFYSGVGVACLMLFTSLFLGEIPPHATIPNK